jgi:hypothetical protein
MSGSKCTPLPNNNIGFYHAIRSNNPRVMESKNCKSSIDASIRKQLISFINDPTRKTISFKPQVVNGASFTVIKKGSGCTITSTDYLTSTTLENIYDLSTITVLIRRKVTKNTNIA